MARYLGTDGTVLDVFPNAGRKSFSLEEMQGLVGGYIEMVELPAWEASDDGQFKRRDDKTKRLPKHRTCYLVLNEEGKLHGLPVNLSATRLWELDYGKPDVIVGNVILASDVEVGG